MKKLAFIFAVSVFTIGFTTGCDGDGDHRTIEGGNYGDDSTTGDNDETERGQNINSDRSDTL